MNKEINIEIVEIRERLGKAFDEIASLRTEMTALRRESDWRRQFYAVALPIMVTIIVAVVAAIYHQNGRFEDVSRRFDDINRRIDDTNQQIREVKQDIRDLGQQMKEIENLIRQSSREGRAASRPGGQ